MNIVHVLFLLQVYFYQTTYGFSCSTVVKNEHHKVYDYYWRDYFGIVPNDALPGGRDAAGNPTYIGQVYIREKELLPGTIYAGCKYIRVSAYGTEIIADKNIKILCVRNPDNYSWIPTTIENVVQLTDYHLIVGGSEVDEILNIGRVNFQNEVTVGKVFSYPLTNSGLYIPYNDKGEAKFTTFEILAYLNSN